MALCLFSVVANNAATHHIVNVREAQFLCYYPYSLNAATPSGIQICCHVIGLFGDMQGQVEEHIYLLFLTLEVAIIFSLKKNQTE